MLLPEVTACLSSHNSFFPSQCAVSSPAVEEMVLIFSFSSFLSKIPFSKNETHFKCQQDLLKLLQSKQSSTLCQEENSATKHLNEGLEPPGESVAYLERGSRGAEHSVFGSEHCLCKALHQGIFTAFP